jgi:hypothetical protein
MITALLTLVCFDVARAQEPQTIDLSQLQQQLGIPADAMSMSGGVERVWVAKEGGVVSKRFATDAEATHVTFGDGQQLRVLYREAGWVRVRDGDRYGWVPEDAVTDTPPEVGVPGQPVALPVPGAN